MAYNNQNSGNSGTEIKAEDLHGRGIIEYYEPITKENVIEAIDAAMEVHKRNVSEMDYLFGLYSNKIDSVVNRQKGSYDNIKNNILLGYGYYVADFENNYFLSDPVVCVAETEDKSKAIVELNNLFRIIGKHSIDREISLNKIICGQAYRYIYAEEENEVNLGKPEIQMKSVDPRRAFIIYSTDVTRKKLASVIISPKAHKVVTQGNTEWVDVVNVQTPTEIIKVLYSGGSGSVENRSGMSGGGSDNKVLEVIQTPENIGIQLIEYLNNEKRLSSIEVVATVIEAISLGVSNSVDGSQQKVAPKLVGKNTNLSNEQVSESKRSNFIQFNSSKENPADLDFLSTDTDQSDEKILFDNLHDIITEITSTPHTTGNITSLGNNGASYISGGYVNAELKSKGKEELFRVGEYASLDITLNILNNLGKFSGLTVNDVSFRFTRRNYEDITSKANVFTMLRDPNFYLSPQYAVAASGLFPDSQAVYEESRIYSESRMAQNQSAGETITESPNVAENDINGNKAIKPKSEYEKKKLFKWFTNRR